MVRESRKELSVFRVMNLCYSCIEETESLSARSICSDLTSIEAVVEAVVMHW